MAMDELWGTFKALVQSDEFNSASMFGVSLNNRDTHFFKLSQSLDVIYLHTN